MKSLWFVGCLLALTTLSCSDPESLGPAPDAGGDADAGAADAAAADSGMPAKVSDPTTPFAELPEACKGFEVRGLKYSPGGSTLPNSCAPYHTLRNNPYAIRCIDADPTYKSGYPGDEYCILPPPAELGTQVYVGPTSYTAPAPGFLMSAGEEIVDYYYVKAKTTEDHYYYRTNIRMRAGSHHMIVRVLGEPRGEGFSMEADGGGVLRADTENNRSFGGAQRPDQDRPSGTLDVPAENVDQGELLRAGHQFSFNLHHFNFTQADILREAWVNIWYKDEADIKTKIGSVAIIGNPADLTIPPGERRILHYACPVRAPVRLITLNGHRHASTSRFGAWVVRKDGVEESIYESYDYNDKPTYQFDTVSKNPKPDVEKRVDGAYTGLLNLEAGDTVHFVCDVHNKLDQSLKFANEAKTGEMCILFGSRTGGSLCSLVTRVD